jgi:hypothetical protein
MRLFNIREYLNTRIIYNKTFGEKIQFICEKIRFLGKKLIFGEKIGNLITR